MLRRISLAIALCLFWLLLSGHYTPFLMAAGLGSSLLIVWFSDRFLIVLDREGHPIHLTVGALTYWPWLFWEIAKSSWDVTKRILDPKLPISPAMVRLKASQRSAAGRVTYANSITLTPGTITMELEADNLLVHALTREGAESLKGGDMDRRVRRFEGSR
jgi:multicomponent Na+:H+ antiporter subunit E